MASSVPSPTVEAGGQAVDETTGAPAAGQGAGGADAPGGSEPGEAAPEPKKARARKSSLPGVMTRDDSDDIFPDLGYKSRTGKRVSRQEAVQELDAEMREESGRGLTDIPPPPPGSDEKKPEAEKPKAQKIKFADKEYDTLEAAEQSFKSLQGMFKPLQEKASKAEQEREAMAELARQWHRRAQELEAGQAQPQPQPQQKQTPTTQTAAAELEKALSRVDGNLFESLAREHGLPMAGRYLAAQVLATVHDDLLPALREEILAQIKPELEPLKQGHGFQQATQHVAGLMDQVAEYKLQDGTDAFPELMDEQKVFEIGDLWRSLNLPAEIALTQQGLLQAIALYRMYNGGPSTSPATPTPQVEVSRPTNVAPRAAAASLEGAGAASPASVRGAETEASRFARNLDGADLVDRTLGFAVRRRR